MFIENCYDFIDNKNNNNNDMYLFILIMTVIIIIIIIILWLRNSNICNSDINNVNSYYK